MITPINVPTQMHAHSSSNNRRIDDSANTIRTTYEAAYALKSKQDHNNNQNPHSVTTTTDEIVLYRSKDRDDYNIGLVGMGNSILNSRRHRRSSSFGNNNDFDLDGKKANNIISRTGGSSVGGSSKLLHSSFRIEQDVIKSLERAASSRGMSLSSLVNKILKNYVTSEMYFEELGFLLVSKNFLRKTFEGLDQKQIEELGREYGMTIAKEYISYFYPQVNADTLIQFLEIWFKRFQSYQHRIDESNNNLQYFTVNHDINMNFSLALQSILGGLIEPIIKSTVEFTNITPSTITFLFAVFRE